MGSAKRQMEEVEALENLARSIAIEAGVIDECEHHDGSYSVGCEEIDEAYKLGSTRLKSGELQGFESQRELTDTIKAVVGEIHLDSCAECDAHFHE